MDEGQDAGSRGVGQIAVQVSDLAACFQLSRSGTRSSSMASVAFKWRASRTGRTRLVGSFRSFCPLTIFRFDGISARSQGWQGLQLHPDGSLTHGQGNGQTWCPGKLLRQEANALRYWTTVEYVEEVGPIALMGVLVRPHLGFLNRLFCRLMEMEILASTSCPLPLPFRRRRSRSRRRSNAGRRGSRPR